MMWKKLINLKLWMPIVFLGAGIGLVVFFLNNKPEARKRPNPFRGTLVEVVEAKNSSPRIELKTHGRVRAAQRVVLTAQVTGVVNWISPLLVEGNFFHAGELLLTLDPLNGVNLDYTLLKAPFNGVVQTRNVDLGQHVNTGTQLATLIGSDRAEVLSDVPVGRLEWLMDPEVTPDEVAPNQYGLAAGITMRIGDKRTFRQGRVERHLLELTPNGMMVQLILSVEDPFRLQPDAHQYLSGTPPLQNRDSSQTEPPDGLQTHSGRPRGAAPTRLPLFIGAFVDVSIPGRILENVIKLPVQSLRDENTVWIVQEGILQIRQVDIVHLEGDSFFVSSGLQVGDLVVTTPLKGAADGLKVRLSGSNSRNMPVAEQRRKGNAGMETPATLLGTGRDSAQKKWGRDKFQDGEPQRQGEGRRRQRQHARASAKKEN